MKKTGQLQIRVSAADKARLRRLARAAGQGVSEYVLRRALPRPGIRVEAALRSMRDETNRKFAVAELSDALDELSAGELSEAVEGANLEGLSAFAQNYSAALVEQACAKRGMLPPSWTRNVAQLDVPWFATSLKSLRVHLLQVSPVAFKRRNLFVDPGASGRV